MKSFTMEDYLEYCSNISKADDSIKKLFKLENDNNKYHYHDMIFKELLDDKEEFVLFIESFFGYKLEEIGIEKYNRKFQTKLGFKVRESDIIYKVKGEETFILLEHQSIVDYKMPERISEYCVAIINSRGLKRRKKRIYPVIFPIVLNTSNMKWDAYLTIIQNGENHYGFPKQNYPIYNVVDINNYEIEELLSKRTGLTLAMAFEKVQNLGDIVKITNRLKKIKLNYKERKCLALILEPQEKYKSI